MSVNSDNPLSSGGNPNPFHKVAQLADSSETVQREEQVADLGMERLTIPIANNQGFAPTRGSITKLVAEDFINEGHPFLTINDISRFSASIAEEEESLQSQHVQLIDRLAALWKHSNISIKSSQDVHAALYLLENMRTILPLISERNPDLADKFKDLQKTLVETKSSWMSQRRFPEAAAGKGKAYQAGIGAIQNLTRHGGSIRPLGTSANEVFLVGNLAAFKGGTSQRAKDEERQTEKTMDLIYPGGILPSFSFKDLNRIRLRMEPSISFTDQQRSFAVTNLSPKERLSLLENVDDPKSRSLVIAMRKHDQKMSLEFRYLFPSREPDREETENLEPDDSYIMGPAMNFAQLCEDFRQGIPVPRIKQIDAYSSDDEEYSSISQFLQEEDNFSAAAFDQFIQSEGAEIFFTPDLSEEGIRRKYEICEKRKWQLETPLEGKESLSLKELQKLFFAGEADTLRLLDNDGEYRALTELSEYQQLIKPVLEVEWKVSVPQVYKDIEKGNRVTSISAKPHVSMRSYYEVVDSRPQFLNNFLNRIVPNSLPVYMTEEMGFFDLHADNVGIDTNGILNHEYSMAYDYTYVNSDNVTRTKVDFNTLAMDFDQGKVSLSTPIRIKSNNLWSGKQLLLNDAQKLVELIESRNKGANTGTTNADHYLYRYVDKSGTEKTGSFNALCSDYASGEINTSRPITLFLADRFRQPLSQWSKLREIIAIDPRKWEMYADHNTLYAYNTVDGQLRQDVSFLQLREDQLSNNVDWSTLLSSVTINEEQLKLSLKLIPITIVKSLMISINTAMPSMEASKLVCLT